MFRSALDPLYVVVGYQIDGVRRMEENADDADEIDSVAELDAKYFKFDWSVSDINEKEIIIQTDFENT